MNIHKRGMIIINQAGFKEIFTAEFSKKIILAASGLIWRHYGRRITKELWPTTETTMMSEENIELVYLKTYETFIAAVDAIDNGIDIFPESIVGETEPIYIDRTTLPNRVRGSIQILVKTWLPAIPKMRKSFKERRMIHRTGRVMKSEIPVRYDIF